MRDRNNYLALARKIKLLNGLRVLPPPIFSERRTNIREFELPGHLVGYAIEQGWLLSQAILIINGESASGRGLLCETVGQLICLDSCMGAVPWN